MGNIALQIFRSSITSVLKQYSVPVSIHTLSLLEKMYHIKEFYSHNREYLIFWIEGTLNQDSNISCNSLLDEMDFIVNRYFGLNKDFPMADIVYKD